MSSYVIGVDPGASCGLAVLVDGRRAGFWQGPRAALADRLRATVEGIRHEFGDVAVTVGCERFTRRTDRGNARTQQSDAEHAIGVAEDVANRLGCTFIRQSPSAAKTLAPNALLRRLGLLVAARDVDQPDADDVNDAMRHALLVLASRHATTFDRLLTAVNR